MDGKCKEKHKRAEGKAKVEPARRDKVEACPPCIMAPFDVGLEEVADNRPRYVVERRCGRDVAGAAKDERRHEVLDWRLGPPLGSPVNDDWGDGANNEEGEQPKVDLAGAEHACRADKTPDDGC